MTRWPTVRLSDVATIERKGIAPAEIADGTAYIGLENIQRGGAISGWQTIGETDVASTKFLFTSRHVLFGKLRPNLGKIARPWFGGVCSTDILPIFPSEQLDRDYLAHYLAQQTVIDFAASRTSGANLPRLSPAVLASFEVPFPPLAEQRRIAAILDQADALRAKRREALAHLDDLTQSVFLDMFGDPVTNPHSWDEVKLVDLLEAPLRNGVSPSSHGKVPARVLTLSAVTGSTFRESASKEGSFTTPPPPSQRVSHSDLLICRGNGNLGLVGRGFFPRIDMPDTVFPDTMIAARVSAERMSRWFLEHQWNSTFVRRQIQSVARTTNGTFKVNQSMLENIRLLSPPSKSQRQFARQVSEIVSARRCRRLQSGQLDCLFESVQDRAFSGRL